MLRLTKLNFQLKIVLHALIIYLIKLIFLQIGQEIVSRLLNLLKELKLNFKNCVGQSYDNEANMAAKCNSVQAVIFYENGNCTLYGCENQTNWSRFSRILQKATTSSKDGMIKKKLTLLVAVKHERVSI